MTISNIDRVVSYALGPGRRMTAFGKMDGQVDGAEFPALKEALARRLAADKELWLLEGAWRRRKSYLVEHGARAGELDTQLDRLIRALESNIQARARLSAVMPDSAAEAARLLAAIFPEGAVAITQATYVDQSIATRHFLEQIRGDEAFSRLIQEIGIGPLVDEIERLNSEYSASVGAGTRIDRGRLDRLRREGHEGLGEIIARVMGLFPTESEGDRERRAALLAPIDWQNDVMRAYYKERRQRGDSDTELDEAPAFLKTEEGEAGEPEPQTASEEGREAA